MTAAGQSWLVYWLRFQAVGGMGIAVQLLVLMLLTMHGIGYLPATALAVEAAIIHNFVWHERFTWRDRVLPTNTIWRFLQFNLSTGVFSVLGNLAAMKLLVGIKHWNLLLANAAAIAGCSLANFLVNNRFVFAKAAVPFAKHAVARCQRSSGQKPA